jgi:hypothetical protein
MAYVFRDAFLEFKSKADLQVVARASAPSAYK